jgi:hypothetical protein
MMTSVPPSFFAGSFRSVLLFDMRLIFRLSLLELNDVDSDLLGEAPETECSIQVAIKLLE